MDKEVSCRVSNTLIRYFDSLNYETTPLLERLPYSKSYLENPLNWIPGEIRDILAERAASILHNEKIMYQIGLSTPILKTIPNVEKSSKLLENPRSIYENIDWYHSYVDRAHTLKSEFIKDDTAVISLIRNNDKPPSRHACYYTQGVLAAIPLSWGLSPARVIELECKCKPEPNSSTRENKQSPSICKYEISWQSTPTLTPSAIEKSLKNSSSQDIHDQSKIIEKEYALLDQKYSELTLRNLQLNTVRQIAEGIDEVKTIHDVFKLIVDLAIEIPGIRLAMVQKADEAVKYLNTPYYSFSKVNKDNVLASIKELGFDVEVQFGKKPEGTTGDLILSNLPAILKYINNPQITVVERLSKLLEGLWTKQKCDEIQAILNVKKIVIIPLSVEKESMGSLVFYLENEVPLDILEMIGTHCCIALKNVITFQNLETRNQELLAINSIAKQTVAETGIKQIVARTIIAMRKLLAADVTSIYLLNDSGETLNLIGQDGMPEEIVEQSKNISINSPFGNIIAADKTYLSGVMTDYHDAKYFDLAVKYNTTNFLTVPLILEAKRAGILTVARKNGTRFNDQEISLIRSIGHQLSIALENAKLHQNLVSRINELEKIKNNLADSEEAMRLTLDSVSEAIMVTSTDGKIRRANEVAVRLHGYNDDNCFLGTHSLRYVDWNDRARMLENLKNIKESGKVKNAEYNLIRKDGSRFPAECSISTFNNSLGEFQGFVICIRDISERKITEAKLRDSERKYRLIAENTNDYIGVFTFSGIYVYLSPSHKQLGYEPEKMLGTRIFDILHPDDKIRIQQMMLPFASLGFQNLVELKKTGITKFLEFRIKDATGEWHYLEASANLIESQDGKDINILTIGRDVTTRKQAQEELELLYQTEKGLRFALEKEINTRAEFFRALVHELKTPLTPIVASSETIMDLIEDKMFKKLAENVYQGALRLNNRVDELLDISRGELGILKLDCQPMDMGLLIQDTANYIKAQIAHNHQILIVDLPDSLPQINADESRLRQVLLNLLNNAMKFTPSGGRILLKARSDQEFLTVEVQDTGDGIDEEEQSRLFKPYNRIEEDRQHFSGLGLGLALSKQLIDLHGGKISVSSQKGQGSTFSFSLGINPPPNLNLENSNQA